MMIHCCVSHCYVPPASKLEDFYVVCVYVPNSGSGLKRLGFRTDAWDDAFARYLGKLGETKPVVLAGDLNVAHKELDLHSPKTNLKSAGFTKVKNSDDAA